MRHWGDQNIYFEIPAGFSFWYLLQGADEDAVRTVFTDDVLAFFSSNTGLSVEARGNKMIYYRHTEVIDPEDMPSFLHEAKTVFHLFRGSQDRES